MPVFTRWLARTIALCACAHVAFGHAASAQAVRGTVTLPDSATPASGAIVVAVDARATEVARGLTSLAGRFMLTLPGAGHYTLRVLRIGFRPTTGPAIDVAADETRTIRLVLGTDPVSLAAVNIRESQTCRVRADTGLAVARVWEEARKAILASQLDAEDTPLVASWIEYDRMLDSAGRVVREQHVRSSTHPTTHAFRSLPAAVLADRGYVVSDSSGVTFYAPDAEVLLSSEFVNDHCFKLEAGPREAPQLIGVAFEPVRDRQDQRDIDGTLWLDRATAVLEALDFRYTNLPSAAQSTGAGGRVEWLRLEDGATLVSRWWVRMPRLGVSVASSDNGLRRAVGPMTRAVVRAIQTAGGEVTRVSRHDTLVYALTGAHVAVQVTARDPLVPAAGALLSLDGSDYDARADASGLARIEPALPGRYQARIHSPLMDSLGMPPITRELEASTASHIDMIALPDAQALVARACPRDSVSHGEALLRGTARDGRAQPAPHAAVTVSWQSDVQAVGTASGGQLAYSQRTIGALADSGGVWRICGVPRDTPLTIRAIADSGADVRRLRLADDQAIGAADLVLHRLTAAAAGANVGAAEHRDGDRPQALVELVVTDLAGVPLADARLDVAASTGEKRSIVTGSAGRALIPDIAPGVLTIRARRIGFREGLIVATVDTGRNTVPILLGTGTAPTLAAVRVLGGRSTLGRLDDFETRRLNHSASTTITREDIDRRAPVDAWQLLTTVASLKIIDRDDRVIAISSRVYRPRLMNDKPCYIAVMVDRLLMNGDPDKGAFDLRNLPPPSDIHGVEIFAGPASIPPQYGVVGAGVWCGLIAIWTR